MTRTAISPRLAISTFRNIRADCSALSDGCRLSAPPAAPRRIFAAARIERVLTYGARLDRRIAEAARRPPHAAAADSARADRQNGPTSRRRAPLPNGQGARPQAEP